MVEVAQRVVVINHLGGSQVYAAQDNVGLGTWFEVRLQWGLPIELDGHVDDIAPLHQAERGRVCPATGDVYAHRATAPYYLV